MKVTRSLTVLAMTVGLAAFAFAADDTKPVTPDPAAAAQTGAAATIAPPAASPTAGLADIPENKAEREAIERGELKLEVPEGTTAEPAVDAARAARRAAFDAVVAEQDVRVKALADRLATSAGDDAVALQRQIETEKLATGRRLLELQLQFATQDGDQARIERIQSAITDWDAPKPTGTPMERTLPTNPNR